MKMTSTCRAAATALTLAALAGCATKEMRSTPFYAGDDVTYTGRREDRINIWPLAYWREPFGAVAWPLVSFGAGHFALRPVYSHYREDGSDTPFSEVNVLWPLCQFDFENCDYRVFPWFWGDDCEGHPYQTLFPIYWNGYGSNTLFPIYSWKNKDGERSLSVLFGTAGASWSGEEKRSANWCFPLWYWNSGGTFATMAYASWKDGWAVPPLFSWGERTHDDGYGYYFLLGLAGSSEKVHTRGKGKYKRTEGRHRDTWAFPLFDRDTGIRKNGDVCTETDLLLNFASWETKNGHYEASHVFPLYTHRRGKSFKSLPFSWNAEGTFLTPLGGRTVSKGGAVTNVYATFFAGLSYGVRSGSWLFPLWNHRCDVGIDGRIAMLDCDELPQSVKLWMGDYTNKTWNAEKEEMEVEGICKRRMGDRYSLERNVFLLPFLRREKASGWVGTQRWDSKEDYDFIARHNVEYGGFLPLLQLLFHHERDREAVFDFETRKKKSDIETEERSLLTILYRSERRKDMIGGGEKSEQSVLWRLWRREAEDGAVSVDAFPGFTWDSKDGRCTQTSFFWRLFRYEKEPAGGVSVDLLFVPVWRASWFAD